jgi:transcriptional regulator with XRE-family HTH domain
LNKKRGDFVVTLYERLSELCQEKGVKGGRMCTDLGFSKSLMTDLKSGRKKGVNAETAQKIATYFGVSVGYLLGEEEKEEKPTVNDDELSENMQALMQFARSVPEDKIELVLKLMRTIVEAD